MLGELNNKEIEELLKSQLIGRIGCHADSITYVVPVTYVYDGSNIIMHSANGMKIEMMRKNPDVCFEVDKMQDMGNWQSVIAWGRFEEITGVNEKQAAMKKLVDRVMPLLNSETAVPTHGISHEKMPAKMEAILFRLKLSRKTGRFEKR